MSKTNWDRRFLGLAEYISTWTKDRSRGVGAVIVKDKRVVAMGYNGFPAGVNDNLDERHERPAKYDWTTHAEENAIANAARTGGGTEGCTIYTNLFPCERCAGNIINAGITKLVCSKEPNYEDETYGEKFKIAKQKFEEGGVDILIMEQVDKVIKAWEEKGLLDGLVDKNGGDR